MAAQVTTPSQFQRALFHDSRHANHSLLPHTLWSSRLMYSAQALAFPLAFWFKPVCVAFALVWLTYRAYQVLNKPLDELASLLGFDIPFTPIIDLAGVKADGAVIHWSLPEKQKHRNTLKYEIHVNGTIIDTVSLHESAVSITGLQPDAFHVVRVALVNSLDFSSKSAPIRFRTKHASSGDFYRLSGEAHDAEHEHANHVLPQVKPFRALKDFTPASPNTIAPPMTRENSTGGLHKRSITGRRPSPPTLGLDGKQDVDQDPSQGSEVVLVQQLTEKLNSVRHETDESDRIAKEEEEEESRIKDELIKERDALKADAQEKDKMNRNLKREVNLLERQNTAAQNERTKQEKLLLAKKQERQKLKDDMVRWEQETEQFKEELENLKQQKVAYLEKVAIEKETLRQQQTQDAAALKALDDEVRETNIEIKKLERAAKNNSPNGAEPELSLVQQLQQDVEEDRTFYMRRLDLQHQYAGAVQNLERAKHFHSQQAKYLENVRAERRRTEEAAAASAAREFPSPPPASERGIRRGDSQRSRHTSNDSPRMGNFPPVSSSSPFGSGLTSTAFSAAPFLNIHNGMTIPGPTESLNMSEEEKDRLTGGAPMSPGAGAELLPADLFSSDDSRHAAENVQPLPGLGALPGLGGISLPGLGAQPGQQDYPGPGPASPTSPPSRTPSLFASPRHSQNNLPTSPDNYMDSDRRSIHSTRSNRASSSANAGSRFSSMFGIKPRVKNSSMDDGAGPALGKVQSQSMPRQDQGIPGLDSAARRRNSSISGTMFGDVLGDAEGGAENSPKQPTSQTKKLPFALNNMFNRDKGHDGWPSNFLGRRPASPRPGSTHSSELPRPSFDSSRWGVDAWPSSDAASAARGSPLSFGGGGWNAPLGSQQSRMYGSRHPSRRPSVQHGASGPPEDIMEDEDSDALDSDRKPHLAPIGTKPPPGLQQKTNKQETSAADDADADAKLNPNAKDFKSFFSSIRLSSKDKEKLKEAESTATTPGASNTQTLLPSEIDDSSPPLSRKSRDARSTTTIESSHAPESVRNSTDLARTPSYSNASEAATSNSNASPMLAGSASSFGKESFMSKLTRKSSSGMFSLPTFKRDKSRLLAPDAVTNEDEEEMSASQGSLRGEKDRNVSGSGSGGQRGSRSWSTALKLGKKKNASAAAGGSGAGEAPSVSGLSITSSAATADEEDGPPTQHQ